MIVSFNTPDVLIKESDVMIDQPVFEMTPQGLHLIGGIVWEYDHFDRTWKNTGQVGSPGEGR